MRLAAGLLALSWISPLASQTVASERTAFRVSLWSTVVPVAAGAVMWAAQDPGVPSDPLSYPDRSAPSLVMAGGFVLGPSFGYQAAGLNGRAWRGVAIRSGLTLLSFVPAFAICGWDCGKGDQKYDLAWAFIATGAGLSAASAIYDITHIKRNVRQHQAAAASTGAALSIAPMYTPGRRSVGVQLGLSF